jgi:uncharacterized membrane protein YdjX (TVP38/TMEM64 family)
MTEHPPPLSRINRSSVLKFIALLFIVVATVVVFRELDLGQYFTQERISGAISSVRSFESGFGFFGPILFWIFGSVAIIINVPTVLIIWFAVMTYGPVAGSFEGIVCVGTASAVIYYISKLLGRDFADRVFGRRFPQIEARFQKSGLITVIYLRLIFFMLPPVNWFLGLMNLSFRDFFLGTVLGTLHNIFINAWLAGIGIELIKEGRSLWFWESPEIAPPILVGLFIFIAIRILDRRLRGRSAETG